MSCQLWNLHLLQVLVEEQLLLDCLVSSPMVRLMRLFSICLFIAGETASGFLICALACLHAGFIAFSRQMPERLASFWQLVWRDHLVVAMAFQSMQDTFSEVVHLLLVGYTGSLQDGVRLVVGFVMQSAELFVARGGSLFELLALSDQVCGAVRTLECLRTK